MSPKPSSRPRLAHPPRAPNHGHPLQARQGHRQRGLDDLPWNPHSSTVRTQLRVLEEKGHVTHEEDGVRYVYIPATPRRAARKSALRHLVDTFFDGSAETGRAAILGSDGVRLSDELLDRIAELVEKARKEAPHESDLETNCHRRACGLVPPSAPMRSALRHWVLAAGVGCAALMGLAAIGRCGRSRLGARSDSVGRGSIPGIGDACITAVARGGTPSAQAALESRATPTRGVNSWAYCGPPGSQERRLASRCC